MLLEVWRAAALAWAVEEEGNKMTASPYELPEAHAWIQVNILGRDVLIQCAISYSLYSSRQPTFKE